MVNVYFLIDSADPVPPGWSEIDTGYKNRLILAGGSLSTGGSDTHNHPGSGTSSDYTGSMQGTSGSGPYARKGDIAHNHPLTVTNVAYVNHLPPYKEFRVIYRNIIGWGGNAPRGAILFSENVPSGWSRVDATSNYFIRIAATAGGTGGSNTPVGHNTTYKLENYTGTTVRFAAGEFQCSPATHGHFPTGMGSATNHSNPNWKYWSAGLLKAIINAWIRKDFYCLFDGDPGAGWELVADQDGRYLKHNGSSPAPSTGGANTVYNHSHALNGISGNADAAVVVNETGSNYYMDFTAHTHFAQITLSAAAIQPSYVKLYVYKAVTDFGKGTQAVYAGV